MTRRTLISHFRQFRGLAILVDWHRMQNILIGNRGDILRHDTKNLLKAEADCSLAL